MQSRRVLITIDTILELLKNYCGSEDIPTDATPLKLMVNPKERNKVALVAESAAWPQGAAPLQINFQIKRIYSV